MCAMQALICRNQGPARLECPRPGPRDFPRGNRWNDCDNGATE